MKTLKGQTVYQCEHCGKRLLSRSGARIHENEYCNYSDSPHQKSIMEKRARCSHENREMQYSCISGECVQEPSHELCLDCGAVI